MLAVVKMLVELRNDQQNHNGNERALDHAYEVDRLRLRNFKGPPPTEAALLLFAALDLSRFDMVAGDEPANTLNRLIIGHPAGVPLADRDGILRLLCARACSACTSAALSGVDRFPAALSYRKKAGPWHASQLAVAATRPLPRHFLHGAG